VDFFRATREIKRVCPGCKISGGVSNIAFSFRGNEAVRRAFHSAFLHHACLQGMDMGIVNTAQVGCKPSCLTDTQHLFGSTETVHDGDHPARQQCCIYCLQSLVQVWQYRM
jgi:hypothetical protein